MDRSMRNCFAGSSWFLKTGKRAPVERFDLNISSVLPALDQKNKAKPLFDLAGGPGASSVDAAGFFMPGRVQVPPAGTMWCASTSAAPGNRNRLAIPQEKTAQHYLGEMYPVDYVQKMRRDLEKRADLTNTQRPSRWMIFDLCPSMGSAMEQDQSSGSLGRNSRGAGLYDWRQS